MNDLISRQPAQKRLPDDDKDTNVPINDCINRQAAINAIENIDPSVAWLNYAADVIKALPSAQPAYTDEQIQKMQEIEQAEIEKAFQLGREEALSDIVRCKDCKYCGRVDKRRFYRGSDCTKGIIDTIVPDKDFCSRGERREQNE